LQFWTLAASVGLAALLRQSEPAFVALKIVGVTYLIFLGVQALRTAWRPRETAAAMPHAHSRHAFRQGLLSDLGNPKIAVFFTSFLRAVHDGWGVVPRTPHSRPAVLRDDLRLAGRLRRGGRQGGVTSCVVLVSRACSRELQAQC